MNVGDIVTSGEYTYLVIAIDYNTGLINIEQLTVTGQRTNNVFVNQLASAFKLVRQGKANLSKPKLLVRTIGSSYKNNVAQSLIEAGIPFKQENGERGDMKNFYVEANMVKKAEKVIDAYYEKLDGKK